MLGSLRLNFAQQSWLDGAISRSGVFGLFMSQIYEDKDIPDGCCWKAMIEYATASFPDPSGCQFRHVAPRLTVLGSLNTVIVFAWGASAV